MLFRRLGLNIFVSLEDTCLMTESSYYHGLSTKSGNVKVDLVQSDHVGSHPCERDEEVAA